MTTANTFTVVLDEDAAELIHRLHRLTGATTGEIIEKLLLAQLSDFWEYLTYLEQLPPTGLRWERAVRLIHGYGPTTLVDDIKRIDPSYVTQAERLMQGVRA